LRVSYQIRSRLLFRLLLKLRGLVLRAWDPVVEIQVGRRSLLGYLSTDYPVIARDHPHQDTVLARVARFLGRGRRLSVIDVGANVGDTWALLDQQMDADFLCIEGNPKFFALLERNTRGHAHVTARQAYLSDRTAEEDVAARTQTHGTCYLSADRAAGSAVAERTRVTALDDLLRDHAAFQGADLLKVDTDGFDYKVLRGALGLISRSAPIVFFELSAPYLLGQGEDPLSIFGLLGGLGYERAIFYDNTGYPVIELPAADTGRIDQLIHYALVSDKLFYDVLMFPRDTGAGFFAREMSVFPMKHALVAGRSYPSSHAATAPDAARDAAGSVT
jgi:FkbM family methyltransferase